MYDCLSKSAKIQDTLPGMENKPKKHANLHQSEKALVQNSDDEPNESGAKPELSLQIT